MILALWLAGSLFTYGLIRGVDLNAEDNDRIGFWISLVLGLMSWFGAGGIIGLHIGEAYRKQQDEESNFGEADVLVRLESINKQIDASGPENVATYELCGYKRALEWVLYCLRNKEVK